MATIPHPPLIDKPTPLVRTTQACPCCSTPLQRWNLTISQAPAQVYWCASCRRPVCLEPPAVPARPAVEVARASA